MVGYMRATTAWDGPDWGDLQARGWTVMGRLRERQFTLRKEATSAQRRIALRHDGSVWEYMLPTEQDYEDLIKAHWKGGPTVLAFLFTFPDSDAIRMLDARGEYFDIRTGDTWDLFFPGYYREEGGHSIGKNYAADWRFDPMGFGDLRSHIEKLSQNRWQYSGGTDLVLINGWLAEQGEPTIDWVSTISGQITDRFAGIKTLTLANVIERITRDIETAAEDSSYGVGEVTDEPPPPANHVGRDFMIQALSGIAAALGAKALGG